MCCYQSLAACAAVTYATAVKCTNSSDSVAKACIAGYVLAANGQCIRMSPLSMRDLLSFMVMTLFLLHYSVAMQHHAGGAPAAGQLHAVQPWGSLARSSARKATTPLTRPSPSHARSTPSKWCLTAYANVCLPHLDASDVRSFTAAVSYSIYAKYLSYLYVNFAHVTPSGPILHWDRHVHK